MEAWRDILTITPALIAVNPTYIAMEDDRAVGFYLLTTEGDGLHLDHLWLLSEAMGRGIGRALFEHASTRGKALGFLAIQIEADPNAEPFYVRMGAGRIGTHETIVNGQSRQLPVLRYAFDDLVAS